MDVSRSATWVSLGKLIPTVQQLDAPDLQPTQIDLKPAKKEHATACIMGKRYTRKQCFLKALEIDNDDHEAWFLLGKCIEDFEQDTSAPQAGPKWSPNPCIEVPTWESPSSPTNPSQYGSMLLERRNVNLYMVAGSDAVILPRKSTRRLYSKQQCYIRALECALLQLRAMTTAAEAKVRAQDGTEGLVVSVPNPAPIWLALSNTLAKKATQLKGSQSQRRDSLAESTGSLKPVNSQYDETLPDTTVDMVVVLGNTYDKQACAVQAVEADAQLGCAWNAVGVATLRDRPIMLQIHKHDETEDTNTPRTELLAVRMKVADLGAKREVIALRATKLDCFIRALERGEEGNTKVWTNTAAHMGINQLPTVVIQGKERSKADCYAMAVKLSDTNSIAWLGLGLSLGAGGSPSTPLSVDIGSVSRLHCLRRAVESDPYNSRAWVDLGIEVATHSAATATATKGVRILVAERIVQVAKTRNLPCPKTIADPVRRGGFTAKDCYVRALELNSSIAEAWSRLGMVLSGTLTQDAIEGAMNMDVDTKVAEVLRIAKLRKTVEKEKKKKLKEVEKMKIRVEKEIATGAQVDDSEGSSSSSSVSAHSDETTESELADRAAFKEERRWVRNYTRSRTSKMALSGLYSSYSLLESVTVRGRPVTKVDCHLRCLDLEPNKSRSWCNMGTGCAYVAGAAKQLEIFIRGWRKDNNDESDARSEVEEEEAIEEPNDDNEESDADSDDGLNQSIAILSTSLQHAVSSSLEQELQGVLPSRDGACYSQRRCYVRAVELDPTASIAWSGLAMTLKLKPFSGVDTPCLIPVVSDKLQEDPYKAVVKLDHPLSVDRIECLVRAAADPNESLRAELWVNLGDCLARPHIDPYTLNVQGYILDNRIVSVTTSVDLNAVAAPALLPKAHRSAPFAQRISALHCFCKAIQLDPDNAMAWYRLGLEMLHLQSKKDAQDAAMVRATACCNIPLEEVERRLLKAIDAQGGLMVDESLTAVGALQCFTAAVDVCVSDGLHYSPVKAPMNATIVNPEFNLFGACWTYLGVCLTQGRLSKCKPWKKGSGQSVDRQGSFFQALEFDPNIRLAWKELGEMLVDGWFTYNTVSIRGREYTKRECIEKSYVPK